MGLLKIILKLLHMFLKGRSAPEAVAEREQDERTMELVNNDSKATSNRLYNYLNKLRIHNRKKGRVAEDPKGSDSGPASDGS